MYHLEIFLLAFLCFNHSFQQNVKYYRGLEWMGMGMWGV